MITPDPHRLKSIGLQYYYSDLSAVVSLMDGKTTRFILSKELRERFEKEMNEAIKKMKV